MSAKNGAPSAETTNLAELVSSAALRDPSGVALVCGRDKLTFGQLDRAVAAMAAELIDRGVGTGDPIAVLAGTGLEFPVLAHGVLRAGGVVVPISPSSPPAEAARLLHAARVEMVLADREHETAAWQAATAYDADCGALTLDAGARKSRGDQLGLDSLLAAADGGAPIRVKAGAPAGSLSTSGSTTPPQGGVHSHEGLFRNALSVAWEMTSLSRDDVMLGALPLAHSFGFSAVLNASLLAGAPLRLVPRFGGPARLRWVP